jgi:hypothetical protein
MQNHQTAPADRGEENADQSKKGGFFSRFFKN